MEKAAACFHNRLLFSASFCPELAKVALLSPPSQPSSQHVGPTRAAPGPTESRFPPEHTPDSPCAQHSLKHAPYITGEIGTTCLQN